MDRNQRPKCIEEFFDDYEIDDHYYRALAYKELCLQPNSQLKKVSRIQVVKRLKGPEFSEGVTDAAENTIRASEYDQERLDLLNEILEACHSSEWFFQMATTLAKFGKIAKEQSHDKQIAVCDLAITCLMSLQMKQVKDLMDVLLRCRASEDYAEVIKQLKDMPNIDIAALRKDMSD